MVGKISKLIIRLFNRQQWKDSMYATMVGWSARGGWMHIFCKNVLKGGKKMNETYCHDLHESAIPTAIDNSIGATSFNSITVKLTFNQITVLSFQFSSVE